MSRVPLHSTIMRHCDNGTAVQILRERGIITAAEAEDLFDRIRAERDAAYERIYGRTPA